MGKSFQLMADPHYENDAQNYHLIHRSKFQTNDFDGVPSKILGLRFYLIQPSPNWTSFGLRDLMCYARVFGEPDLRPKAAQKGDNLNTELKDLIAACMSSTKHF